MASPPGSTNKFGGIGRALSNRDYRVYWVGQVLSVQGVWINRVAAGLLIFKLTGSYAWLGAIGFVHLIPMMFLAPLAGAVADRLGHRRTAIIAGAMGLLITVVLSVITFAGVITPALLAMLIFALGITNAIEFPARQAMIPRLIRRGDLSAAIAMNSTTFNMAAFIGPAIGGGLVKLGSGLPGEGGHALAFSAQAFTVAWMLTALILVNVRDLPKRGMAVSALLVDLKEGTAYTFRELNLRWLIIMTITMSALIRGYVELMPGFAVNVFANGNQALGESLNATLLSASGAGALVMSILLALRGRTSNLTGALVWGGGAACLFLVLFTATSNLWVGMTAMVLTGGAIVTAAISAQTLVQNVVANEFRARMISIYLALALGSTAIGTWILGRIADVIGIQLTVGGAAVVTLAAILGYARPMLKRRAEMEADPPTPPADTSANSAATQ